MTDAPRCHCGNPVVVVEYRLLPRRDPADVWPVGPTLRYACGTRSHQDEVVRAGAVLAVRSMSADIMMRKVKDEP